MDARQIAGRFAAYTWYMEVRAPRKPIEAARFARNNWQAFVPIVNEGLGLLLERIAWEPRRSPARWRHGKGTAESATRTGAEQSVLA